MSFKKKRPKVIFEDNHLFGVLKPTGWLSQGDETGDISMLEWGKGFIKQKYDKPGNVYLQCVHRLDRPASGVMIYAKTSKVVPRLNNLFKNRKVSKTYLVITQGKPPKLQDKITHYLNKNNAKNIVNAYSKKSKKGGAKKAVLSYRLIGAIDNHYLLRVDLETGRSHQIRAQLSEIGCPVSGDLKYNAPFSHDDNGIALHCYKLSFMHPVRNNKRVTIKHLPRDNYLWPEYEGLMNTELD